MTIRDCQLLRSQKCKKYTNFNKHILCQNYFTQKSDCQKLAGDIKWIWLNVRLNAGESVTNMASRSNLNISINMPQYVSHFRRLRVGKKGVSYLVFGYYTKCKLFGSLV